MKTGLIMEGGAMRGMFTAGVMDVMMENGLCFDGAIGVSAGAAFGCNYKSNQIGRVIRYNTAYCRDKRFCSIRSLIKTGDMYGADFCYREMPEELDIFDVDTYVKSPMEFYVVCTDVITGKAVYKKCEKADRNDLIWMRASASMPLVSRIVRVDGFKLLDGGIADSVPLRYFESIGYTRSVIILTQPREYVKKKNKYLPLIRVALGKYPEVIKAVKNRHDVYNETLSYIREKEALGEVFVISPDEPLGIGSVERDKNELLRVYNNGRAVAERILPQLVQFMEAAQATD